jgi:hypothetical protein
MHTLEEATQMIESGAPLMISGAQHLMDRLPPGNWIGGTSYYFMTEQGGRREEERLHVQRLPEAVTQGMVKVYGKDDLKDIYRDIPGNGLAILILSAFSEAHRDFALHSHQYDEFALRPLMGWVAGVRREEMLSTRALVYDGRGTGGHEGAVVMHCTLREHALVHLDVINIFRQGQGDTLTFPEDAFEVIDCWVNGEPRRFVDYLLERNIDRRLPLVADYMGTSVNVDLGTVDETAGKVTLVAPVMRDILYRFAEPVPDYARALRAALPAIDPGQLAFCVNCADNFLYGGLEGETLGVFMGPCTFGEVAYQLLNQTIVYALIR